MDTLERMVEFTRRTTELTADETRSVEGGWIFDSPSLDVAYGLNHVRLAKPMSFAHATELADAAQARLPFRRITVEPQAMTRELESAFTAAGWKAEHDLLMVLARPPDRQIDTSRVEEVDEASDIALARLWTLEEAPETSEKVLEALSRFWSREARARGDRHLGIRDPGGDGILAKAKLRSDGSTAQVEDVYTIASARGRGLGRAIVTRAVELAQAEEHALIFIIADADDWPQKLYRQIGFDPVATIVHFHRDVRPPAVDPPRHRRTAPPSA